MRVSIIVPALDEARAIVATLVALQPLRAAGHEVIVVDGGSLDATVALATPHADRVCVAARGRALQMNAGAAVATGDILLFLHADSRLPADSVATLVRELGISGRRWGRFDVAIAGRARALRWVEALMNLRSRATGIATGDQAVFVERALFREVGGYPDQPLMEDIEMSGRLKRAAGSPLCLRQRVVTSARRWERHGPWRTVMAMWRWRFAYWRGASSVDLAAEYDGKPGKVRWTGHKTPHELGMVNINPICGQLKGVAAYAYTEFTADRARPAELRLGTKNAWKVWLNGRLLFEREEYHRGMQMDQYRLTGQLQPGRNTILVKVCQNELVEKWTVEWEFQLRVCDPLGAAIQPAAAR